LSSLLVLFPDRADFSGEQMATTVAEATGAHVPARKKLRQVPASTSTAADTETQEDATERKDRKDKKRKKTVSSEERDGDGDGDDAQTIPSEKATKRHKKRRRDQDTPVSPAGSEEEKALKDEKSTSKTPRKSVAFATDVKSGDNDGAQPDPTEADESVDDDDDDDNTQEGTREEKLQRKREKREQRRRDATGKKASPAAPLTSTGEDGAPYEAPVLSYLRQYYEDRSSWKFQKNRETHLLKHILSLEQLPSRYNRALLAYLQGLKSEGARQRLRITAQGAIRSDEEPKGEEQVVSGDLEDKDRDGEVGTEDSNAGLATAPTGSDETSEKSEGDSYAQAIQAFRANLVAGTRDLDETSVLDSTPVDARNRLERRQRAELVLWAVNGKISRSSLSAIQAGQRSGPNGGDAPNATVKANQDVLAEKSSATNIKKDNAPKKKKRKNRTVVVEISSSSESSSDSEASGG
jgi:hypothetical protein